ncbi:hypothetical protein D8L93_06400 [Sodalis-like symbiont of Bactericera trigonica]|nr:hypothetical protein D8L93_06400 [Sodalis-like symbiont of Bactericera trigonica]
MHYRRNDTCQWRHVYAVKSTKIICVICGKNRKIASNRGSTSRD